MLGEAFAWIASGGHVGGDVEQHVRIAVSLHLVVDGTCDDVTWGKIASIEGEYSAIKG